MATATIPNNLRPGVVARFQRGSAGTMHTLVKVKAVHPDDPVQGPWVEGHELEPYEGRMRGTRYRAFRIGDFVRVDQKMSRVAGAYA